MDDDDRLQRIDGLFVGMLDKIEMSVFEAAIRQGRARRVYEGGAGILGLAKVRLIRSRKDT